MALSFPRAYGSSHKGEGTSMTFISRKNHRRASSPQGTHVERLGGYSYGLNRVVIPTSYNQCWCGEGMLPNRGICSQCCGRLPNKIQRSLSHKGRFIDSWAMTLKRAVDWLRANPVIAKA